MNNLEELKARLQMMKESEEVTEWDLLKQAAEMELTSALLEKTAINPLAGALIGTGAGAGIGAGIGALHSGKKGAGKGALIGGGIVGGGHLGNLITRKANKRILDAITSGGGYSKKDLAKVLAAGIGGNIAGGYAGKKLGDAVVG